MVIHHSDKTGNFGANIKVQEASLDDFACGALVYGVIRKIIDKE